MRFYGYKHWTLEDQPRCFYVGKGLKRRPFGGHRSSKWHAIVDQYGLRVEICIGPVTNEEALKWEIENIALMDTYTINRCHHDPLDIRCNFTKGGDGGVGHVVPDDARKRIGDAQRGKPKSLATRQKLRKILEGRIIPEITRHKMSVSHKGKPLSEKNRQNLWKNRSRVFSNEHRIALSVAARQRQCSLCKQCGHNRLRCPLLEKDYDSQTSDCNA